MGQTPYDGEDQFNKAAGTVGNGAKSAAKKGAKVIAKKCLSMAAKGLKTLAIKAIGALISALISLLSFLAPVLLLLGGVTLAIGMVYSIIEYRGNEKQYSYESSNEFVTDNSGKVQTNEQGKLTVKKVQFESQLVSDYYTYMGSQSWYQYDPIANKIISPDQKMEGEDDVVRDFYEREKLFSLSSDILFSLDERIYKGKFLYAEQFIKPINHVIESGKVSLRQLTDDKGYVIVESKELNQETGKETGNKIKSVRDYGLGSIMQYMKAERKLYIRGTYTRKQTWVQPHGQPGKIVEEEINEPFDFKNDPYESTAIHLLTRVAMFGGEISYTYEEKELELGPLESGKTDIEKMPKNMYLYGYADVYGWVKQDIVKYDENGVRVVVGTEDVWKVTGQKPLYKYRSEDSVIMELMPRETSTETNDQGTRYFYDYFNYFEAYIPNNVIDGFDFESRIDYDSVVFTKLNYDDATLGSSIENPSFQQAMSEYLPIMQNISAEFGVDPYIILAMAYTESSGNHESNMEKCKNGTKAACGLMQIEKPGQVITGITATNTSGEKVTMTITGPQDVESLEDNIRAGVMQFKNRMETYSNNTLIAIQSYNYGVGGMNTVLNLYAEYKIKQGESGSKKDIVQSIIANPSDIGWIEFLPEVHKNPQKYIKNWKYATFGTPNHVLKVLGYYAGTDTFSGIYENKNIKKPELDSSLVESVAASGGNFWAGMADAVSKFFRPQDKDANGNTIPLPVDNYTFYCTDSIILEMITTGKSMGSGNFYSEEYSVDESKNLSIFDSGFLESFNSIGLSNADLLTMKPTATGFVSPLNVSKDLFDCITAPFGENRGTYTHKGVDFGANKAGIGQDVSNPSGILRAVKSGTIKLAQSSTSAGNWVIIDHGDGIETVYMHLDSLSVRQGQVVQTGDPIGVMGNTGNSQGRHLHFELKIDGKYMDPMLLYSKGDSSISPEFKLPDDIRGSIVKRAEENIGGRYVWGGTDLETGVDCSGFVMAIYKDIANIKLHRTSSDQYLNDGVKIEKSELQPGDLVFYGYNNAVSHVAIYVGGGEIIHASDESSGIKKSSLERSYGKPYIGAKRILTS